MVMACDNDVQEARRPSGDAVAGGGSVPPVPAAALVAIVAGAAALRVLHLDQPVRYDEAVTFLRYVARPLSEALATYDLPNNHLFHTLLAHLSVDLFGGSPEALRLPAMAAGTLVVPATWLVGRRLASDGTGLLAAGLTAVSPVLVLFSTNARGYAPVVLAFLALILLAAVLARRWSGAAWGGFVLVAALGGWTIPVMLYPAVAAGAWWLLEAARAGRRPLGRVTLEVAAAGVAAAGLAALLYLPVLRQAGLEALTSNRFVAPRALPRFVAAVPGFLADVAREWTHGVPGWASALVGTGALVEGVARTRAPGSRPVPVFPVALATSLAVLAATRRTPFARVWLFLLPALLLFAASGLRRVLRAATGRLDGAPPGAGRGRDTAAAVAAPLLAAAVAVPVLRADVVRGWGLTGSLPAGDRVAELVAERWEPGDAVRARLPSDAPLAYHLHRRGLPVDAVNARAEPGGCIFVVVNLRHGQTLPELAGGRSGTGAAPHLLGAWDGTRVYGVPASPAGADGPRDGPSEDDAAGGEDRCRRRETAGGRRWRSPRRADTFASIHPSLRSALAARGGRARTRETTETPQ